MDDIRRVIASYDSKVMNRCESFVHVTNNDHLLFGVSPVDMLISLRPGVTVIYSHTDLGKTSFAKSIAVAGKRQGFNVVFYDVENKLTLHDSSRLTGIGHATSSNKSGLQNMIRQGIVDMIIVDTITGIPEMSQELFLAKVRPYVPYIILTAQMREPYYVHKSIPAAKSQTMSAANTVIVLESKETITIEGEDFVRTQFIVEKYEADRNKKGERSSFIIRNNFVDNVYSAYDSIRSAGIIRSLGRQKIVNWGPYELRFDSMKKAVADAGLSKTILQLYYHAAGVRCPNLEVYLE